MLSRAKPHLGLSRNQVSAEAVSPTVCGLRSYDERDGALTIDSISAEARNAEWPTPSGQAHPHNAQAIPPSLALLPNLLHSPRAPFSRASSFSGVRRLGREGEVRAPISKHVRAAINGHRKRTKRKSSGRMSRTPPIYLYICIAAPNAVRPKKRIQRERKSSASQCLKGAPLKLVILKPPLAPFELPLVSHVQEKGRFRNGGRGLAAIQ